MVLSRHVEYVVHIRNILNNFVVLYTHTQPRVNNRSNSCVNVILYERAQIILNIADVCVSGVLTMITEQLHLY